MKKFYIKTFGCQMNVYDGLRIAAMLEHHGFERTENISDADIILLNTCAVRAKATDKVYSALGRIRRAKKPNAIYGIVGCVARESGADAFRKIRDLNFVLGPQSYHKLPEIINDPTTKLLDINLGGLEKFDELPPISKSPHVAYIPIQEGCNHCCTYCIVPYTRGPEISRPYNDILAEIMHSAAVGAIEICLLGQNVNGYKYTDETGQEYRLSDIIQETAKIDSVKRIRFTSSYPTEMTDELIDLFRTEPKLLPFLNMPIQSGSENVLKRMNRPYDLTGYMEIINKFHAARPDIQISSDFIVGFPGESDTDFEQTMTIAKQVRFINSYSFKYSPRPHTAAALMPNQIPENIKSERLIKLDSVLNENQREFNLSCIDKIFECLYEGPDKTGTCHIYRTPYMQPCIVSTQTPKPLANIKITSANKSCLHGKIVD